MKRAIYLLLLLVVVTTNSSAAQNTDPYQVGPLVVNQTMNRITDVMVHDIFTPPVASRIYAYSTIAGYTAYAISMGREPFTTRLNEFPTINRELPKQPLCPSLVMSAAMFRTARALMFSEDMMDEKMQELIDSLYTPFLDEVTIQASLRLGTEIGNSIIAWSATDGYRETRKMERYTPKSDPDSWEPTPPDNADAVEPYWNRIRPFVLDSAEQCRPPAPTPFSTDPASAFYQEAMEVFDTKKTLTADQEATVWFWDDNPFVTVHQGHLVYAKKKVSPAGHWMGITQIAINQTMSDQEKAITAYTMVSIGMADAFISCWDEKYRSDLIRPVTYINRTIDPSWEPYLQTPPFPEYTSGHSVVSASASMILTELFGDGFAYRDDVLERYGQAPRDFKSFIDAANEAAYSRLYGGIHYRPGIEVGVSQGRKVAQTVIADLL